MQHGVSGQSQPSSLQRQSGGGIHLGGLRPQATFLRGRRQESIACVPCRVDETGHCDNYPAMRAPPPQVHVTLLALRGGRWPVCRQAGPPPNRTAHGPRTAKQEDLSLVIIDRYLLQPYAACRIALLPHHPGTPRSLSGLGQVDRAVLLRFSALLDHAMPSMQAI